jgi:Uma2 family endonuclease
MGGRAWQGLSVSRQLEKSVFRLVSLAHQNFIWFSSMSTQPSSVKYTYEDFLLFPEDGRRHEIIDGEHYATPSPPTRHQKISGALAYEIKDSLKKHRGGQLYAAPLDVVLSDLDIVEPDLVFVASSRNQIITEKNLQGSPDLVVEILSSSTRRTDEIIKRKLYERYAVAEYWVVDPELDAVKVYRMAEGRYVRATELTAEAGEELATPLLPGLKISLTELFRR